MPDEPSVFAPRFPPTGNLFDVGGYRLHLDCRGDGRPAVIMEAAIWDFGLTWGLVQPEVARFTHACVYDRAGLGWSDPSPRPRTAQVMVEELHALLNAAAVPGPYVLVGHSFAGMPVRLFAHTYPGEVAGLVLVDAAHEDQNRLFPPEIGASEPDLFVAQLQFLQGVREQVAAQGHEAVPPMLNAPGHFPPEVAGPYQALLVNTLPRLDALIGELSALEETRAQLRAARVRLPPDLPLRVLAHGHPQVVPGLSDGANAAYEAAWQAIQADYAAQSSHGALIRATNSGHMIHHDEPALVVEAIRAVVELVRAG